jgi:hypothetical protein
MSSPGQGRIEEQMFVRDGAHGKKQGSEGSRSKYVSQKIDLKLPFVVILTITSGPPLQGTEPPLNEYQTDITVLWPSLGSVLSIITVPYHFRSPNHGCSQLFARR